jgi:hypothetical protein
MARTRVEVKRLTWDLNAKNVTVTLHSLEEDNSVRLMAGVPWNQATIDGNEAEAASDNGIPYVPLTLRIGSDVTVVFALGESSTGSRQ